MITLKGNTLNDRLDYIYQFVVERESIRLKKEAGKPRPWTDDPILDKFHFCNVRRRDDRVTKFIGEWAEGVLGKWFAFAVARWFNEPEVLQALRPAVYAGWNASNAKAILKKRKNAGAQIFRGSYIITGAFANKGQDKYEAVVDRVLTPLWKKPPLIFYDNIEASWLALMNYTGFGSFMAGQVVADWQTFGIIHGRDVNTWAPLGPGSARGLYWVFEPPRKIDQKDAVKLMIYLREYFMKRDAKLTKTLTLHDVQNCLCEFSKYTRGYSKTKYQPYEPRLL